MGRDDGVSKLSGKYRAQKYHDLRNLIFQKEKRCSVVLGLGAGSFEYSVADPPTRRKQVSPWTNRPIFVPWGSVCVKAKGSQN